MNLNLKKKIIIPTWKIQKFLKVTEVHVEVPEGGRSAHRRPKCPKDFKVPVRGQSARGRSARKSARRNK